MHYFSLIASLLAIQGAALRILMNNDDGWVSANTRELYRALKESGHDVLLVAPATQQSSTGGTVIFTTEANLTGPAIWNSVPAGAPSYGSQIDDPMAWYYNGTPAACTFFALDYVVPRVWGNNTLPDLMVSGPNQGSNAGPFVYELSGTLGATYSAIQRNIPGIAFSAVNSTRRYYGNVSGEYDPATLGANASARLINQLASKVPAGQRLLPLGYGINVNLPLLNETCSAPPFVQTRMTGGAAVDRAVQDAETGLFDWVNIYEDGVNACINGDCSLPGETKVIKDCAVSVSVFTTDYDAPNCAGSANVRQLFEPLVEYSQGGSSAGGSSSNNVTTSSTSSAAPVQQTTNGVSKLRPRSIAVVGVVAAMVMFM